MKVLHVSTSDVGGGAFVAARRLHNALLQIGVSSEFLIDRPLHACRERPGVVGSSRLGHVVTNKLKRALSKVVLKFYLSENSIWHSISLFNSGWLGYINNSDADIVNLHWVQGEMLSIEDIGAITKPVVWTLHDMWPFCGAEHVAWDSRWKDGYSLELRPHHERGLDINRWVWERKRKSWVRHRHLVCPSNWMKNCASSSHLMRHWPVARVANPINTDKWSPMGISEARAHLGLPQSGFLLLMGSWGGEAEYHKGFDLLDHALGHVWKNGSVDSLQIVKFGGSTNQMLSATANQSHRFKTHDLGRIVDANRLVALYSACDVLVIPSRFDNLPNVGIEGQACGLPIVGFDTCGIPDLVSHLKTGYLASSFDTFDLACGIAWVARHPQRKKLREAARLRALSEYDSFIVAQDYLRVYQQALS